MYGEKGLELKVKIVKSKGCMVSGEEVNGRFGVHICNVAQNDVTNVFIASEHLVILFISYHSHIIF